MQEFNVKFTREALNVVLGHLDNGPHREVRSIIDGIIAQINAQSKPPEPPKPPSDQDQQ